MRFVIAGNKAEYDEYLVGQKDTQDLVYVTDIDSFKGYRIFDYILHGTWHQREDLGDVMAVIESHIRENIV